MTKRRATQCCTAISIVILVSIIFSASETFRASLRRYFCLEMIISLLNFSFAYASLVSVTTSLTLLAFHLVDQFLVWIRHSAEYYPFGINFRRR